MEIMSKPIITPELREQLGPLALLAGVWEGDKGDDIAPSDDRQTENNKYRERITLEIAGAVNNHEQVIHALRYSTVAWRVGEQNPFHEELGYWTWEPLTHEVMKCFLIPRGISVIAGGVAKPDDREFKMVSTHGSATFGICSSPFLDKEFKVVKYELTVKIIDENTFTYSSDTVIQMPGRKDLFHHTDQNRMVRVK